MAEYKIFFKKSACKDFKSIPNKNLSRILDLIKNLGKSSCPAGCTKLSGQEKYRVRLGQYRIIYSIQDKELTVWVVKLGHRKDVYR